MTTLRDHIAAKIQEALPIITQLAQHEHAIQQANTKPARRQAEDAAGQKRLELYGLEAPAAIYHYLRARKLANGDGFRTTWQRRETQIDSLAKLPAKRRLYGKAVSRLQQLM